MRSTQTLVKIYNTGGWGKIESLGERGKDHGKYPKQPKTHKRPQKSKILRSRGGGQYPLEPAVDFKVDRCKKNRVQSKVVLTVGNFN